MDRTKCLFTVVETLQYLLPDLMCERIGADQLILSQCLTKLSLHLDSQSFQLEAKLSDGYTQSNNGVYGVQVNIHGLSNERSTLSD